MLVSTRADAGFRREVSLGSRPAPEFLRLEERHGVEILDWSRFQAGPGPRSVGRSCRHVASALRRLADVDVVFSDGEHVGIPLAVALRALRIDTRHLMLAHHLLTPSKVRAIRALRTGPRLDRVLTHSANQLPLIIDQVGLRSEQVDVVPYGIDTSFWSPQPGVTEEDGHVCAAGREHRDYRTLVAALPPDARLSIADHSPFTPDATRSDPPTWPPAVRRVLLNPTELRELYGQAALVVVPAIPSTMPAGITVLLEAMAMGKAVIVTETEALRGVVRHNVTGITVAPGDVIGLRKAIEALLGSPETRHRLGGRAREEVVKRHDVDGYAAALAGHMADIRLAGRRPESSP